MNREQEWTPFIGVKFQVLANIQQLLLIVVVLMLSLIISSHTRQVSLLSLFFVFFSDGINKCCQWYVRNKDTLCFWFVSPLSLHIKPRHSSRFVFPLLPSHRGGGGSCGGGSCGGGGCYMLPFAGNLWRILSEVQSSSFMRCRRKTDAHARLLDGFRMSCGYIAVVGTTPPTLEREKGREARDNNAKKREGWGENIFTAWESPQSTDL